MIRAKINVLAIDKAKLFKGAKGTYLDIALIETPDDKYGNDFMIVQDVGKDARERGEKGAILGNAKVIGARPAPAAQPETQTTYVPSAGKPAPAAKQAELDEDVPF